jgi:hypothetical protein
MLPLTCTFSVELRVELRGFEPLTPSMRTERTTRQSGCCGTFPHVSGVQPGMVTASDRA